MTPDNPSGARTTRQQISPQQLMTRFNAVMFYGVAAASLLETAMSVHARALAAAFAEDAECRSWIEDSWALAKAAHALRARAYVEAIWSEFDWSAAYEEFALDYRRLVSSSRSSLGVARIALACTMAAAQAAVFYRGLGAAADDPDLRCLLKGMASDEAMHFGRFRGCYERHRRREHLGMLASFRTVVACVSRARDIDVQLAFNRLSGHHWYGSMPLQNLSYGEFVARLGSVVRRHLPLGLAQRLLFKPWLNARGLQNTPGPTNTAVSSRNPAPSRLAAGT